MALSAPLFRLYDPSIWGTLLRVKATVIPPMKSTFPLTLCFLLSFPLHFAFAGPFVRLHCLLPPLSEH